MRKVMGSVRSNIVVQFLIESVLITVVALVLGLVIAMLSLDFFNQLTERNYLWTGNIDLACFAPDCQFQDPTLSFTGRDQFVTNVQNLQPILEAVQIANPHSILLDIQQTEDYVQTRWNMVGSFGGWLFWKPQLNVIGNTKFWFRPTDERPDKQDQPLQVYFYEEEWEMPAYKALLQLLRPGQKDTASA